MVCINSFHTDTKEEIAVVRKAAEKAGARVAVSITGLMAVTVP